MTRRTLLRTAAVIVGGASVAILGLRRWNPRGQAAARRLYARLTAAEIEPTAPGLLDAEVTHTLLAVTTTLVDIPIEPSHYEDFFRWRASSLRGYASLYEKLTTRLDEKAGQIGQASFIDCDAATRRRILAAVLPSKKRTYVGFLRGIIDSDLPRFDIYVVREILQLFNRTDSWTRLGYESWPGTARGLDLYTRAPARSV
jgi:hypothetical protein